MRTIPEAPVAEPPAIQGSRPGAGEAGPSVGEGTIEVTGLGHAFGDLQVIERLDLPVGAREAVGLVGPSGCNFVGLDELHVAKKNSM